MPSCNKQDVPVGWRRNFTIRHGKFRTFDDPIALNAFDYSTSNTHVGWLENGLIEDCYDLDDRSTTGYFCRILGGAWCDWKSSCITFRSEKLEGLIYPEVNLTLRNVVGTPNSVVTDVKHTVNLTEIR